MEINKIVKLLEGYETTCGSGEYDFIHRRDYQAIAKEIQQAMNYIPCCETLKDEGQATLTEYATELINMQEKPQDSNKEWKIVVMQNTIGKLHETIKSL